jgi:hypothetical protein
MIHSEAALQALVGRYVAIWNEPDSERRRAAVAALWTEDATQFMPSRDVHGHEQLFERVTASYDRWVAEEGCVFRSVGNGNGHHDCLRFNWEMLPAAGGEVVSVGFQFLILGDDGRIRLDYQFIDR